VTFDSMKVDVPDGCRGPWRVEKFTVPKNDWKAFTYALHGRPIDPGTYTRLMRDGHHDPMMSDTPAEIRDHYSAIFEIKHRGGRILINGLGLGVVLKAALSFSNVTHVDVVECERDIIDLVWPTYATDSRAYVHHTDAHTIEWPMGTRWTVAWHDIWPTLTTDNFQDMTKLHRKYGRRVDWQGSWSRDWLRAHMR